ncbi:MAG: DUF523 domain-containing protein [Halarsenatibacteraceae bacterium]
MITKLEQNKKPLILISRCLGFKACRYDGSMIEFNEINKLKEKFILKPICPEVAAGLGVPRPPIRLLALPDRKEIGYIFNGRWQIQTDILRKVIRIYLRRYNNTAGMILKEKSPSCGIKLCKYYRPPAAEIKGRTGGILIEEYTKLGLNWPFIDEVSFKNPNLRQKFIKKVKKYHKKIKP